MLLSLQHGNWKNRVRPNFCRPVFPTCTGELAADMLQQHVHISVHIPRLGVLRHPVDSAGHHDARLGGIIMMPG